jgi:hypothetical protein
MIDKKDIGTGLELGRCVHVWEGESSDHCNKTYIYDNDEEMKQRYDDIAWEEQYKKKCLDKLNENNDK